MVSRRNLLKLLAGSTLTAGLVGGHSLNAWQHFSDDDKHSAPWWLLTPLHLGDSVGKGWRISGLRPIEKGATVLELQHFSGDQTQIHICAIEEQPVGVVHTQFLDLILMDGGQGQKATDEDLGRVVMNVALKIRKQEGQLLEQPEVLKLLEGHDFRMFQYGSENLV